MEMPEGWKRLKKLARIPIVVEGEKKLRTIYYIPKIKIACELMKEMAEALEVEVELDGRSPENHETLKKFKEWK